MELRFSWSIVLALTATVAVGATRGDLERDIASTAAQRDRLRAEHTDFVAAATSLAQTMALSRGSGRAGAQLTTHIREFDRLAEALETLERRLGETERTLRRLLARFDELARAEEQALEARARSSGARSVADEVAALAAARDRLAALRATESFRPPLEISLDPTDGPDELQAKKSLLEGERLRLGARVAELDHENVVLTARLRAKRQWARDLGAARRESGGGVELLDLVHEKTEATMESLARRLEELARERALLLGAEARLAATGLEATERLRRLVPGETAR